MRRVEVSNDELRSMRDTTRELGRLVENLERDDAEKYVITRHVRVCAVLVSIDQFAAMRQQLQGLPKAA